MVREWFLPEGYTALCFDTWLLIYDPGPIDTTAVVYALTETGQREIGGVEVPARARRTVRVGELYEGSLSLRVVSDEPLCCERSTYWSGRAGGTCSPGYAP